MGKHSKNEGSSFKHGIPTQRDELLLQRQIRQEEKAQQNTAPQPAPQFAPATSIPLFGRKKEILRLREEIAKLTADNQRLYADNVDMSMRISQLGGMDVKQRDELIRELNENLNGINREIDSKQLELNELNKTVLNLRDYAELQEDGFYDYENPAENSVNLSAKLAKNKARQKSMVKSKTAVHTTTGFTFNNSAAKGRTFLNDMSRMALSLYNAEAENCVKNVKAGNLDTSIKRLNRCHERIQRFGKFIDLHITWEYQHLRIEELQLTSQYMQAVQAEKEAERERKAELREQAKAQKELEAEMARLHKEQEHYQNVLAKMREQGNMEEAAKLEAHLVEIDKSINDVDYRAANIRAGYVYVISDVGAFGERMVKIGMTRRLNPMDRVRELSDASVPFKFDVHALFFSKDAVSLETMLHHEFEDRRVNKVNARKEFYYCTPQEVLDKLKEKNVAVVEYRVEPEAEEYRISQRIAEKQSQDKVSGQEV
ncbi:DUF4041 domain-containing protein [uncultured Bifidobacterium sp.]|uniref:DUF4041 domain-containing protein n=1 Tax=uncultured Bifidobacterium sp. TaxID=165187 RepID=UPI00260B9FE9|nr:DUF4041 domain-containing protein [uncultured Bifidobacterium sp.]